MLEPILKGLVEWIYQLLVDIMGYASGELIGVMSMDLAYFKTTASVINSIVNIFTALGWALLIGNLMFQLLKSIISGIGFEVEDPKIIFLRTFVFSFLLLASNQICEIGSSITGTVISLLQVPTSINVTTPNESMFALASDAKWLLVVIVGVVLMIQMVKLLFEIGERYVITSVLTFFAPLAFSMGGSKNTNDIFKGWCRMYASMLVMMIMNIVFLKLIMSAMSRMASGGVLVWLVFVVALTRVARKIDSHIGKLGLNPAQTGDGLGSRLPGVMTMMAVRAIGSNISHSLSRGGAASDKSNTRHTSAEKGHSSHVTGSGRGNTNNHRGASSTDSAQHRTTNTSSYKETMTNNGAAYAGKPNASQTRDSASMTPTHIGGGTHNQSGVGGINSNNNTVSKTERSENSKNIVGSNVPSKDGTKTRPPIPRNTYKNDRNGQTQAKEACHVIKDPDNKSLNRTVAPLSARENSVSRADGSSSQKSSVEVGHVIKDSNNKSINNTSSPKATVTDNTSGYVTNSGSKVNIQTDTSRNHTEVKNEGGHASHEIVAEHERFQNNDTEHLENNSHDVFNMSNEHKTEKTNHEYKHGKYNPAAVNKKAKTGLYKKTVMKKNDAKRGDNRGRQ